MKLVISRKKKVTLPDWNTLIRQNIIKHDSSSWAPSSYHVQQLQFAVQRLESNSAIQREDGEGKKGWGGTWTLCSAFNFSELALVHYLWSPPCSWGTRRDGPMHTRVALGFLKKSSHSRISVGPASTPIIYETQGDWAAQSDSRGWMWLCGGSLSKTNWCIRGLAVIVYNRISLVIEQYTGEWERKHPPPRGILLSNSVTFKGWVVVHSSTKSLTVKLTLVTLILPVIQ